MTRPKVTSGKRQRQEQKRSKAQAKAERRTERQTAGTDPASPSSGATESELLDELAELHHALEDGTVELRDFEERREHIRTRLEALG